MGICRGQDCVGNCDDPVFEKSGRLSDFTINDLQEEINRRKNNQIYLKINELKKQIEVLENQLNT